MLAVRLEFNGIYNFKFIHDLKTEKIIYKTKYPFPNLQNMKKKKH